MKNKLTQEYLKECLIYNPETGIFIWKERPLSHFKNSHGLNIWNSKWSNKESGGLKCDSGYLSITIDDKSYYAHRLAFLYMEGYLPENLVDHIDRNRANNKWKNLREASQRCNLQNCNLSKANKSGVTGVTWRKSNNKWRSIISINSKNKYLGTFENLDEAIRARYQEEVNNPEWTCSVDSSALKYLKENNLI